MTENFVLWVLWWCAVQKRHFMYIYKLLFYNIRFLKGTLVFFKRKETWKWKPDFSFQILWFSFLVFGDTLLLDWPSCDSKVELRTALVNHIRTYRGEHLAFSCSQKIYNSIAVIDTPDQLSNTKSSFYLMRQSSIPQTQKFLKYFPMYNVI